MPPLLFIPLGALGLGLYAFSKLYGDVVVVYDPTIGDARSLANQYLPSAHKFTSIQAAVTFSHRISKLIIIAHGGPTWIYDRSYTPEALGAALAPVLTTGAWVGLAGCSTARSPSEPNTWDEWAFSDGGDDSYAGRLRDAIRAHGGPLWGTVAGHAIYGHTLGNPSGREFSFLGGTGKTIKPQGEDYRDFIARFQGEPAARWISQT